MESLTLLMAVKLDAFGLLMVTEVMVASKAELSFFISTPAIKIRNIA